MCVLLFFNLTYANNLQLVHQLFLQSLLAAFHNFLESLGKLQLHFQQIQGGEGQQFTIFDGLHREAPHHGVHGAELFYLCGVDEVTVCYQLTVSEVLARTDLEVDPVAEPGQYEAGTSPD